MTRQIANDFGHFLDFVTRKTGKKPYCSTPGRQEK
jgi:hypothetical protein